jgi:hypothetical protein
MNWEALGAIGEIVGAAAVVVTLGYLAVQIRQNTKSVQAATFQSIAEGLADASYRLMNPPPGDQRTDLFLLFVGTLRRYENLHFQIRRGTLDRSDVEGFFTSLAAVFEVDFFRECWPATRTFFHPAFASYVEEEVLPRHGDFESLRESYFPDPFGSAAQRGRSS